MIHKIICCLLAICIMVTLLPSNPVHTASGGQTALSTHEKGNMRYIVGMVYYDMWRHADGKTWQHGKAPNVGEGVSITPNEYHFSFSNRKVKKVNVYPFYDPNRNLDYFFDSRPWDKENWINYRAAISGDAPTIVKQPPRGIGTSNISIQITVNGILNASKPQDKTDEECAKLGGCAANVLHNRIYFPVVFEIELAGTFTVKHFKQTGESLNHIFPNKTIEMIHGRTYPQNEPPTHRDYTYVGFKKSTTANDPTGSIISGRPWRTNYDVKQLDTYTLHLYYKDNIGNPGGGGNQPNPDPGTGFCSEPSAGRTLTGQALDPLATATIQADDASNAPHSFNVTQGIPTSEHLYGQALGRNYLFTNQFVHMKGVCTYEVPVQKTYTLHWTETETITGPNGQSRQISKPQQATETVSETITINRNYDFWKIDRLEVYELQRAQLKNYALPSGELTLSPAGYTPPDHTAVQQAGIVESPRPRALTLPSESVRGGSSKPSIPSPASEFRAAAEASIGKVNVQNDELTFLGQTIMNGGTHAESAPTPGSIPMPTPIGPRVLYQDSLLIASSNTNREHTPSYGHMYYDLMSSSINGGANKEFPIYGINPVTVHTPVVIYASISDDRAHNQKTRPNPIRSALILDRPFQVSMPTSGPHAHFSGYGNRDYAKYTSLKQVYFPFDVYTASGTFVPKGTWHNIAVNERYTSFRMPVWVDEGDYTVLFRSFAENAPYNGFSTQRKANTDLQHHVAVDMVDVEVIGRVFDFRITDVMDLKWEQVFRKAPGSKEHTGAYYWVGEYGIDGQPRGNQPPYELPIRRGSHAHSGYKNVTVKQGYAFKFDLKTTGNMFAHKDGIRVTPTFYFVDKKGQQRQEVDLYYHTNERYFNRIGSTSDTIKRKVVLDARLRNVPQQTLRDTAAAYYDLFSRQLPLNRDAYIQAALKQAQRDTEVGRYSQQFLPERLRTYIGPTDVPNGVNRARAFGAVQQWYSEFNLPSKIFIVPKGFDLSRQFRFNDSAPFFLRDGYLIINFNIETVRNGDMLHPHLQYIHAPLTNQWKREGFTYHITDPYGVTFALRDGDVMFYHADQFSVDDFSVRGTH
ncbi:DUF5704 domain-containing protein [Paenibacillus sp. 481]|uniref:DUF5704 domain-containing protein n=1 Tax=Paenibacillus sp. 481 TaxID=2835869 RepID=UPI001E49BC45|nr:DUF5704 domain-containing protein [Paenibacillus sp. 481]UHA72135.1 hypothetical protein KIK04_15675 [Paenibacillus sp. 481]